MKTFNITAWVRGGFLMILFLSSQGISAQEITLPETAVGKIAKLYFEAFNADDPALMRDFTAKYRTQNALDRIPLDSRMVQHNQIKGMIKSLSPRKATPGDDNSLTVLVYAEAIQSWFETSFVVNNDNPPKLEKFGLKPATAPEEDGAEGFGEWTDLNGLLQNVIAKHNIPGLSMAVIKDGKLTEAAVAGVRQTGTETPITIENRFHIGSITKSMTATLIGKLIEDKQLKAETTLKELFPEISMLPAYEAVTVQQLLNHRAGIPAYLTVTDEEEQQLLGLPGNDSEQRLAFVAQVLQEEPNSKPGTAFAYSNAGYSILGAITEKLTAKTWKTQLDEVLFAPLEMTTAGVDWPRASGRANEPAGHFGPMENLRPQNIEEYELGAYIEPAGDVHSSMQDLAKYALAHMNGVNGKDGLLKAETIQWLHHTEPGQNYAAGWFVSKSETGHMVHEHAGSAGTFLAMIIMEPENNQAWVIAANAGGLVLDGVFRKVIETYKTK